MSRKLIDNIEKRIIQGDELRLMLSELLTYDEFKNVKKINVIDFPIYSTDSKGTPLTFTQDFLGGEGTKIQTVESINLIDGNQLNEEIDLYSIDIMESINEDSLTKLGCGVWLFPPYHHNTNFNKITKMEISFDVAAIMKEKNLDEIATDMYVKEIVLRKVSELLDSKIPNTPMDKHLIIRCSNRSIKKLQD